MSGATDPLTAGAGEHEDVAALTTLIKGDQIMSAGRVAVAALGAAALLVAVPMSATAQGGTGAAAKPRVITTEVVAPFNLAVRGDRLLVADGATSTLSRVVGDGSLRKIADGPGGGDVAGVAISKDRRYIAYTTTEHPSPEVNAHGTLHVLGPAGSRLTVDLARYEARRNPDKVRTYGTTSTDPCVTKAIAAATGLPATYRGQADSHPYSVTAYGKSSWLVADAGGNDLLRVDARGRVRTLAVLPVQRLLITKEVAAGLGLPACTVGTSYRFEAVPTDVEQGASGSLYVSTLPGGPELGARGSVYRVNPRTGHAKRLATGFAGATNVAVLKGKVYVAEFFAGRISTVHRGGAKLYTELPGAVSVEAGRGHLYAGTFAAEKTPGTIVRLK